MEISKDILRCFKNHDMLKLLNNISSRELNIIFFLNNEKCLDKYIDERLKAIQECEPKFFVTIISAFNWADTKQGIDFWSRVYRKYNHEFYNI